MLEAGKRAIVNIASMSHKRGEAGTSIRYTLVKGAVLTMTLEVPREYAGQSIRCLSISPGLIDTEYQQSAATPEALIGADS